MSLDRHRNELVVDRLADTDRHLFSVTTVIDVLDNGYGLDLWKRRRVAEAAVKSRRTWEAMLEEEGPDAAVSWLMDAVYRKQSGKRSASALGSASWEECSKIRPRRMSKTGTIRAHTFE